MGLVTKEPRKDEAGDPTSNRYTIIDLVPTREGGESDAPGSEGDSPPLVNQVHQGSEGDSPKEEPLNQNHLEDIPSLVKEGAEPPPDPSHEKTRDPPGSPNGLLKKAMIMLRERCKARGYSPERSVASRDARDLKAMLEEGNTLEDIFACYDSKVIEPRFQDRHVPMAYIREDIGAFLAARGGKGRGPPGGNGKQPAWMRRHYQEMIPDRCDECGQYISFCCCGEEEPALVDEGE